MLVVRYSKIALTASMALLASLVLFGNVTDYTTNFVFVQHVMRMDTVFPDTSIRYRAINSELLHHLAYVTIIALEALTALLCWLGTWAMFRSCRASSLVFHQSKRVAIAGLTLGFLVWQVGFMTVGGEWFGMWMSDKWNGIQSAFRFFMTMGLVLIYLVMPDTELEPA